MALDDVSRGSFSYPKLGNFQKGKSVTEGSTGIEPTGVYRVGVGVPSSTNSAIDRPWEQEGSTGVVQQVSPTDPDSPEEVGVRRIGSLGKKGGT